MQILTQGSGGLKNYHGTVGKLTNMYDSLGNQLYVGDVVALYTVGDDSRVSFFGGINFVCEEDGSKAAWTGIDRQYVMGIADIFNSKKFEENFTNVDANEAEQFEIAMEKIDAEWRVERVKNWYDLVSGEKIDFIYVEDVRDGLS